MRAVAQRVAHASATVDGETTGAIGRGVVVLLGVTHGELGRGGFLPVAVPRGRRRLGHAFARGTGAGLPSGRD